jgi:hypothetical protein
MPYLFIKMIYPPHKIDSVVKRLLEVLASYAPDPSLGEEVATAAKITDEGITGLIVFEVKKGKFDEAFARLAKLLMECRNIEGLRYSIDVWATSPEVEAAIGMGMPG